MISVNHLDKDVLELRTVLLSSSASLISGNEGELEGTFSVLGDVMLGGLLSGRISVRKTWDGNSKSGGLEAGPASFKSTKLPPSMRDESCANETGEKSPVVAPSLSPKSRKKVLSSSVAMLF